MESSIKYLISFAQIIKLPHLVVLVVAQYFSAFFIFSNTSFLFNTSYHLHVLIICSVMAVSAGYLINYYYDYERDFHQNPQLVMIKQMFPQNILLKLYVLLFVGTLWVSFFVSWRLFLFFLMYQIALWLYSHKISRILWINNLVFTILALWPFFGLWIFYKNFSTYIFFHAGFLFVLVWYQDIIKDLLWLNADKNHHHKTLPVVYGYPFTYKVLTVLGMFNTLLAILLLIQGKHVIGKMWIFYFLCLPCLFLVSYALRRQQNHSMILLGVRFLILLGVLCIPLVNL